jgi:hypothetical protein
MLLKAIVLKKLNRRKISSTHRLLTNLAKKKANVASPTAADVRGVASALQTLDQHK